MKRIGVSRSITGPVLIQFGDALNGYHCALTEEEAIRFCDALRRIIEGPTQAPPIGENVIILSKERPNA